jgi:hypothetical protein
VSIKILTHNYDSRTDAQLLAAIGAGLSPHKIPGTGERAEYFIGGDVMKIKIVPLVIKATIYGGWSVNVNPTAASKNITRVGLR